MVRALKCRRRQPSQFQIRISALVRDEAEHRAFGLVQAGAYQILKIPDPATEFGVIVEFFGAFFCMQASAPCGPAYMPDRSAGT